MYLWCAACCCCLQRQSYMRNKSSPLRFQRKRKGRIRNANLHPFSLQHLHRPLWAIHQAFNLKRAEFLVANIHLIYKPDISVSFWVRADESCTERYIFFLRRWQDRWKISLPFTANQSGQRIYYLLLQIGLGDANALVVGEWTTLS